MYSAYGPLCTKVYELSKPVGYSTGDVEYYTERLKGRKGKTLEVGCGSGRVLVPLLESGIPIEGIDYSSSMLDSCRAECHDRGLSTTLYLGDMGDFSLDEKYSDIIIPGGSFQLIEEREKAVQALRNFYDHLESGGRLILDLFLDIDLELNKVSMRTWEIPPSEAITLETRIIEVDFLKQKTVSLLKYEQWSEGQLLQTELQRFPLCWYGLHEFQLLLESIGYKDVTISADYSYGTLPTHAGAMLTYEAIKY
ncbi:class I SAM-dependent methyltransferase [Paenibacillus segetis]|uniref:class I SAM-dependent methyltransferase n=1 Tax=Paenibacillus segetis TaxID=1325360 RepID=UPI001664A53E|nr:class I SAM-dependent methyltransferase [Paenibacillus segetis]